MEEQSEINWKELPLLGIPVNGNGHGYLFKERAIINTTYRYECGKCHAKNEITASKAEPTLFQCTACHTYHAVIAINPKEDFKVSHDQSIGEQHNISSDNGVDDKEQVEQQETGRVYLNKTKRAPAVLTQGPFYARKSYQLYYGENVVGRRDPEQASDICIDDDYCSRRSIMITVKKVPGMKGNTYKLTVNRASNPIFVNSKQIHVGESTYLSFNDKIRMGQNTVLTLKSSK